MILLQVGDSGQKVAGNINLIFYIYAPAATEAVHFSCAISG